MVNISHFHDKLRRTAITLLLYLSYDRQLEVSSVNPDIRIPLGEIDSKAACVDGFSGVISIKS